MFVRFVYACSFVIGFDSQTDPVIQSIERRMGIVTGIPPHQHEVCIYRLTLMTNMSHGDWSLLKQFVFYI